MLWISAALVFGIFAWFVGTAMSVSPELPLGVEQFIHARVPWLVLGVAWVGGGLGLASLFRGRRWFHWPIVGLEAAAVALLSVYFLQLSFLPDVAPRVALGDAFPAYSLQDQDGEIRAHAAGGPRPPALYVFYRGDW